MMKLRLYKYYINVYVSAITIYSIRIAMDGEELIGLIEEDVPDILVTDICMPFKSGLDVVKYIREHKLATKILLISGYDEFVYAKEAISLGVSNYMLKPFLVEELYKEIDKVIMEINNEWQLINNIKKLENYSQHNKKRLLRTLLNDLTEGTQISSKDIENYGEIFSFNAKYYCSGNLWMNQGMSLCAEEIENSEEENLEKLLSFINEDLFTKDIKLNIVHKRGNLY